MLRGYDAATLAHTITAASTLVNAVPFNHAIEGALVRNVWTCIGATAGLSRCRLRPPGNCRLGRGAARRVRRWLRLPTATGGIEHRSRRRMGHRGRLSQDRMPAANTRHSAVQASIRLSDQLKQRAGARVESIRVETHARGLALNITDPDTVLAGKFSMPHAMATVAVHGDAEPRAFDAASLVNPEVTRLRSKVELVPHPCRRTLAPRSPGHRSLAAGRRNPVVRVGRKRARRFGSALRGIGTAGEVRPLAIRGFPARERRALATLSRGRSTRTGVVTSGFAAHSPRCFQCLTNWTC